MTQRSCRRAGLLTALGLAIGVLALVGALTAPSPADPGHERADAHAAHGQKHDLRRARAATRRFRDIRVAREAGYTETSGECAEDPKYGAMGVHYGNPEYLEDGRLDVTKPEVLVYRPTPGGKLRLGAVEYFTADADQDLDTDDDRPSLFGLPFDGPMHGHEPGMPKHYDLHVWLYRHNPAGLFAAWNPRVHCPGTGGHHDH
jgi:hypothetical protein